MTIKDIAQAAGVSAATVSRIINHKDDNISQETRDRVLRIITEKGYVPYAKIRDRILSQSRTIGLLIPTLNSAFYVDFASQIQQLAQKHNYSLVLSLASWSAEAETAAIRDFARNHTDGVIIFSGSEEGLSTLKELYDQGMGAVALDHFTKPASFPRLYRDSVQIAESCTRLLLEHNCTQIGLVLRPESAAALRSHITAGYNAALSAAGLPIQQNFITALDDEFTENFRSMADAGLNAVVCQDTDTARMVYTAAARDGLRIPEDLSVISMEDSADALTLSPPLTAAATDVAQMAQLAFECLLSQIDHMPSPFSTRQLACPIQMRSSIRMRRNARPKILVAGYLNTDVILRTPDFPRLGRTQVSAHLADFVGGKGANQSYGISTLGGNAYLLGCLGSDRRGRFIYEHLTRAGVKMDGVSFLPEQPTGAAYISLYPSGRSSVLIDPGANTAVDAAYIRRHERLWQDAAYCLAQTDIPMESVVQIHQFCEDHHVPMILSPAYAPNIPAAILRGLYILVLREADWQSLYPHCHRAEDCAAHLMAQGVENVIIIGDIAGCLWAGPEGLRHYPAPDYPCVDATGTNDVFLGCLVTLLTEQMPLEQAIGAASWAAAYSATRMGVQNGFPDRTLLEDVAAGRLEVQITAPNP